MLSIAVQHHPSRASLLPALLESLGPGAEVVEDPDPSGFPSPWRTHRHALELTPAGATHRLVLQDDVVVCPGFAAAAAAAVAARPDSLVTFFVAGRPQEYADLLYAAARRESQWVRLEVSRWVPTVALCWPVRLIAPLLAYVDEQNWPVQFRADDEIAGRFMRDAACEPLWATVPSLVEHPDVEVSLVGLRAWGGSDEGRVAACYIGGCDAASIDWT